MEAIRDRIMFRLGTDEPFIPEQSVISMQWRKPLRIDEVNQMAPIAEVLMRPGRP
jgi:hypothetical protein